MKNLPFFTTHLNELIKNNEPITIIAGIIDGLYIEQASRDAMDCLEQMDCDFFITDKTETYFELEFAKKSPELTIKKNQLIFEKPYQDLLNEFWGKYFHGKHFFPNDLPMFEFSIFNNRN